MLSSVLIATQPTLVVMHGTLKNRTELYSSYRIPFTRLFKCNIFPVAMMTNYQGTSFERVLDYDSVFRYQSMTGIYAICISLVLLQFKS